MDFHPIMTGDTRVYFWNVALIRFNGTESTSTLAFREYDGHKLILGKTMREHLCKTACYWHTFVCPGSDVCGAGTFNRACQESD